MWTRKRTRDNLLMIWMDRINEQNMAKKETAVDWLRQKLFDDFGFAFSDNILHEAKEMEKEQIMDAHLTGLIYPLEIEATKQAEQYYNETFGE